MSKFVEIAITMTKNVLVEVVDDSSAVLSFAEELAADEVGGEYDYVEIVDVYDVEPKHRLDERIYIEDYTDNEE